jgi:hypothetical protein
VKRSIEFQSEQSLNISRRRFAWRYEAGAYKAIKEELDSLWNKIQVMNLDEMYSIF